MKKYQIINPVTLEGKDHKTGTIDCGEKDAAPLVESGSLVEVKADSKPNDSTTTGDKGDQKPTLAQLKKLAKKAGIVGYNKMNADALTAALEKAGDK